MSETNLSGDTREVVKLSVIFFLFTALLLITAGLIHYYTILYVDLKSTKSNELLNVELGKIAIEQSLQGVVSDLMYLAKHNEENIVFAANNRKQLKSMANDFQIFSQQKRVYDQIRYIDKTGMEVNLVLATESDIEQAIDLYYSSEKFISQTGGKADKGARSVSKEIDEETEIVEAVDMLFNEAIKMGASDVHIEPREKDVRIRFRVDGVLQQYYTIPKSSMAPMISRVKILANMDIAESRVPQDGRFSHNANGKKVDVRASTFPAAMGEKVVLRILDESRGRIELHKLGFSEDIIKIWRKVIRNPNGIVLVSGPTGSGKTTTLYATMNIVNTVEVNIMTIEDPIEYQLDNINQAQVNPRAGLTFSTALRSMLRQDPDILMVGEMRDVETIEIAVRAALTGHLVFSTIHTNDAASTFTRLLDMGLDSFLISSSIRAVLAQRLIRILCPRCKLEIEPTDALLESIGVDGKFTGKLYNATGCAHCKNSGYHGRAGVYELLIPNEEITDLINKHATATEIKKIAEKNGMTSLTKSALVFVNKGLTSVEEMIRITMG